MGARVAHHGFHQGVRVAGTLFESWKIPTLDALNFFEGWTSSKGEEARRAWHGVLEVRNAERKPWPPWYVLDREDGVRIGETPNPDDLLDAADTYLGTLGDHEEALKAMAAFELAPSDSAGYHSVLRLLEAVEDWPRILSLTQATAASRRGAAWKVSIYMQASLPTFVCPHSACPGLDSE